MALLYEQFRVSEVREFDPVTGANVVKTYEGTAAQMDVVEEYWRLLNIADNTPTGKGYRTTRSKTPQKHTVVVRVPDDILYTDRWSLDSEVGAVPIWWTTDVKAYNPFMAALDLSIETDFRRFLFRVGLINSAVTLIQSGQDPNEAMSGLDDEIGLTMTPFNAQEYQLMFLIIKDGGYANIKHPVLKRNRTIPFAVAGGTTLVGPPKTYSTATLISTFGVPSEVAAQISTVDTGLPTTYPNFVWSWKLRRDDSETMIGYARTMECRDWVFGNWSTITHTYIS